jgi:hypothetical protein
MTSPSSDLLPEDRPRLSPGRYLDLIEAEARQFADVARRTPPGARSASYPGYDATSLTVHVGSTFARTAHVVRTGELQDSALLVPPPHRAPADWLEDAAGDLVAAARATDASRVVPSFPFGEVKPLASVYRSALTEVAVHRWDLESAGDSHAPVETDLAVDLLDAIFDWWAPVLLADRRIGLYLGGTVVLDAIDAGVRWLVTVEDGVLSGRRTDHPGGADAALAGPADRLLVAVWKRAPRTELGLTLTGDAALVDRFLRIPYIPDPQITAAH